MSHHPRGDVTDANSGLIDTRLSSESVVVAGDSHTTIEGRLHSHFFGTAIGFITRLALTILSLIDKVHLLELVHPLELFRLLVFIFLVSPSNEPPQHHEKWCNQ